MRYQSVDQFFDRRRGTSCVRGRRDSLCGTTRLIVASNFQGSPCQIARQGARARLAPTGAALAGPPRRDSTTDAYHWLVGVDEGFRLATRSFFARDVLDVAPALLGCVLGRHDSEAAVSLLITEVEAYAGERDPGAHSYRGKTRRNQTLFGPPGHLYCYFTYGMHHALNVVVGASDQPYACLIRAGDVVGGIETARQRRLRKSGRSLVPDDALARGPGCVAQCFDATLSNDGDDLLSGEWRLLVPKSGAALAHLTGPRVGVAGPGGDAGSFPWRFWLSDHRSVSTYRPGRVSPPARE